MPGLPRGNQDQKTGKLLEDVNLGQYDAYWSAHENSTPQSIVTRDSKEAPERLSLLQISDVKEE